MPPWLYNVDIRVHKPIKTVATASKLVICVILCLTLSFFSSFAHQTARESTEIVRPRGMCRSVIVVTRKCKDPANKPPPHFCPMLACTKGGGVIAGFYGTWNIMHECSNHIQHEDEARGLYVVTHKCIIPYSTSRGVLTGLYPCCTTKCGVRVWSLGQVPVVSQLILP